MLGFFSIAEASFAELATLEEPVFEVVEVDLEIRPVMIIGSNFFRADRGETFNGDPITVVLERVGLTIEGMARDGSIINNPSSVKLMREVWPIFRGEPGTIIQCYAGYQYRTEENVVWQGPFPFVIGQDTSWQPLVEGVYLGIKYTSIGQPPWKLLSEQVDIEPTGEVV